MNDHGMVTVASGWSVGETIDRLQAVATGAGLQVFARIDHAGNAASVGMDLRPTELLVFGNPQGGTPLMQDRQTSGIDLPVKALAWQDADGKVWLTYNDADMDRRSPWAGGRERDRGQGNRGGSYAARRARSRRGVNVAHGQGRYRVRFDWGLTGAEAIADGVDVAVVVDVLSFTTTLSVAMDQGMAVLPYPWRDDTAQDYARAHDATLAVGRSQARDGQISLSPVGLRAHPAPPGRLVLPSPNGSMIAHHFAATEVECIGACLRNADAVAAWLSRRGPDRQTVAVIAAGERWPSGELRPAVEDAWGAGAVLADLNRRGWTGLSPEAHTVMAAYESVHGREFAALLACASGRELTEQGYRGDVQIAAEIDQSRAVPRLLGEQFRTVE